MNRAIRKRKCLHCRGFFVPDYRNVDRQRYCSKPPCKQASKADSQRRWLQKPENHDHFRGPDNVKRVQLWRHEHPGYWRRPTPKASETSDALQETCTPQSIPSQSVSENLQTPPQDALQDSFFLQPAVVVGLIAQLTGFALQDDIALMVRRLQQLGRDILDRSPSLTGGHSDAQTPDFSDPAAPRAEAVQLGGSALGP
jgi:hypothetical protein